MYVPVTTISSNGDSVSDGTTCFFLSELVLLCALEESLGPAMVASPLDGVLSSVAGAVAGLCAPSLWTSAAFALRGPSTRALKSAIRSHTLAVEPARCALISKKSNNGCRAAGFSAGARASRGFVGATEILMTGMGQHSALGFIHKQPGDQPGVLGSQGWPNSLC